MAGSIIIPLLTGFDSRGIKQAESAFASFGSQLKNFGRTAAVSLASYAVGAKAFDFVKSASTAAMDLQRNMSGVATIFGDLTPKVKEYIDQSEKIGLSHADAAKAVTFLGSVFKQTGMPMDEVITRSEKMVSLGADLAATYGYSVQEALTAMTATFRGEYDPIEKFGVAMKQQQVNAILASRGLDKLTGSALIAAQQQVRYEMILQRTTDAQGAFARNSDLLFEKQQVLTAEFTDMKAALGAELTPALIAFIEQLKPIIEKIGPSLVGVFQAIGTTIVALAPLLPKLADLMIKGFEVLSATLTKVGPQLADILGFITDNLPQIIVFVGTWKLLKFAIPFVQGLRVQMALLQMELRGATAAQIGLNIAMDANPVGLVVIAIAALTAGLVGLFDVIQNNQKNNIGTASQAALDAGQKAYDAYQAKVQASGREFGTFDQAKAFKAQQDAIKAYEEGLKNIDRFNTAWASRYPSGAMYAALYGDGKKTDVPLPELTGGTKVKSWFENLQELVKQEAAKVKLVALGASAGLADSIVGSGDQWKKAFDRATAQGKAGIAKLQALWNKTAAGKAELAGANKAGASAVDAFYKGIEEEIKKQNAIGVLKGLGYSTAFIEAVVGSGADWQAVFDSIIVKGQSAVAELQGMFLQTAAGIAEQNAAITAANQAAMDAYNKAMEAYNARKAVRDSILGTVDAFKSLTALAPEMGQFETLVANAMDGLKSSLDSALAAGDLTQAAYQDLLSYAQKESAILASIAKQRDALAQKMSLAKAVIADVKAAIMGAGNLTSLVQGQSSQVTETYKKIIDGVEVTVSRTVEIVKNADLVQAYRDVLTKTKLFASQLMQLKAMGLNSTLFKQIVDAGVDAGGSTAASIIAGGADAVNSLNDVFAQLDVVSGQVAEQTAQVMYGNGVDVTNGLIAGLEAQDAALAATAQSLASTFISAFQGMLNTYLPAIAMPTMPTPTPLITGPQQLTPPTIADLVAAGSTYSEALKAIAAWHTTMGYSKGGLVGYADGGAVTGLGNGISDSIHAQLSKGEFVMSEGAVNKYGKNKLGAMNNGTYEDSHGSTYNIVVNAGMGTDGGDVGRKIVNEIKRYERNNGSVWVAA